MPPKKEIMDFKFPGRSIIKSKQRQSCDTMTEKQITLTQKNNYNSMYYRKRANQQTCFLNAQENLLL